jgi:hypothetical protein
MIFLQMLSDLLGLIRTRILIDKFLRECDLEQD